MKKIKAIVLAILCVGLINFSEGKQYYIKSGDIAAFRAAITESNTIQPTPSIWLLMGSIILPILTMLL